MFEFLKTAPPDKILSLSAQFNADPRPGKVDLGVGVYRSATGETPVMSAIARAEAILLSSQTTKSYLGLAGNIEFNDLLGRLVLGESAEKREVRTVQAPGGSGALRILGETLRRVAPGARIWLPDPTWANHKALLGAAGFELSEYPYFDPATGGVKFDEMVETLRTAAPRDIVLLHGCCHNPTGANLTPDQWSGLAALIGERGLFPFVDLAYQGFGYGLEQDAEGTRILARGVPEMAVAVSCSKNFGLYRERTGAAILIGDNARAADNALSQLLASARQNYSMPPDHGAACVRIVLEDEALRQEWMDELESMRLRMLTLRQGLAAALKRATNSDRFAFIAEHRGMFSRLGLSVEQVDKLRRDYAIYMVDDSRINIAGLPEDRLDAFAEAIASQS
jgi:aspartate/tyrosine/aromatic aminotransferase